MAFLIPNLLKCYTNIIRSIVSNAFTKFKSTTTQFFLILVPKELKIFLDTVVLCVTYFMLSPNLRFTMIHYYFQNNWKVIF